MRAYIVLVMMLSSIGSICAQNNTSRLQAIRERIAQRDSIILESKRSVMVDSLISQVADYELLSNLLSEENDSYSAENKTLRDQLHNFMILTSNDTIVFSLDIKGMNGAIPTCLQERVDLICSIAQLKKMIEQVECKANEMEQVLGNSPTDYAVIREKIEPEIDKIQNLIHNIKEMNLSSLSEEQQRYFRPGLTNRYNSFEKYF